MAEKECSRCIHHPVCKTAESCDGYVSGCEHFAVISNLETTTREKLIELLNRWPCFGTAEEHADHLIANGVTVQSDKDINVPTKWISVKDRLPEPFVSVLVQMPGEKPFPTVREGFISNDGIWQSAMFRREAGEVTHWQPMPQPPKGE